MSTAVKLTSKTAQAASAPVAPTADRSARTLAARLARAPRRMRDPLAAMVQEARVWNKAIAGELKSTPEMSHTALRATLHALRDRIGPANAVHLGAQLPTIVRGLFYEGWRMTGSTTRERHKPEFLDRIATEIAPHSRIAPERAAHAVFKVLWDRIDPGEAEKIARILPREIRAIWIGAGRHDGGPRR